MTNKQLAAAGLASQGRGTLPAEEMTEEECGWIAATVTPDGLATAQTDAACLKAMRSYYDRNKATGDDVD